MLIKINKYLINNFTNGISCHKSVIINEKN